MLRQCEAATLSRLPDPTHSGLDTGHRRREDKRASQFSKISKQCSFLELGGFCHFALHDPQKQKGKINTEEPNLLHRNLTFERLRGV